MDGRNGRAITLLLRRLDLGEAGAAALAFGDELGGLRIRFGYGPRDRVAGGDGHEAGAEDRVRAGGEDLDFGDRADRLGEPEAELQAAALADPILLHQPDFVRPLV